MVRALSINLRHPYRITRLPLGPRLQLLLRYRLIRRHVNELGLRKQMHRLLLTPGVLQVQVVLIVLQWRNLELLEKLWCLLQVLSVLTPNCLTVRKLPLYHWDRIRTRSLRLVSTELTSCVVCRGAAERRVAYLTTQPT